MTTEATPGRPASLICATPSSPQRNEWERQRATQCSSVATFSRASMSSEAPMSQPRQRKTATLFFSSATMRTHTSLESLERGAGRIAHTRGNVHRTPGASRHKMTGERLSARQETVRIAAQRPRQGSGIVPQRRDHARGQHHQTHLLADATFLQHVLSLDHEIARRSVFCYLRNFAFDEMKFVVLLRFGKKQLVFAGRAEVDVVNINMRVRILRAHISGLFERCHAADAGAVLEVIVVARSGALDKSNAFYLFAIRRADDAALGGARGRREPFHLDVGDHVGMETESLDHARIERLPTSGPNHRLYFELAALRRHLQFDRAVCASGKALSALLAGTCCRIDCVTERPGKIGGKVNGAGCSQAVVERVRARFRAGRDAGSTGRTSFIHKPGPLLDCDPVPPVARLDLNDFGQGETSDVRAGANSAKVDFETA